MLNLLQSNFALESLEKFFSSMGFTAFFSVMGLGNLVMILIACFLLYLAIKKEY